MKLIHYFVGAMVLCMLSLFGCNIKDSEETDPNKFSGTWEVVSNKAVYYDEEGKIILQEHDKYNHLTYVGCTYSFDKDSVLLYQPDKILPLYSKVRYIVDYREGTRHIELLLNSTIPFSYELLDVRSDEMTWTRSSRNIYIEKNGITVEAPTGLFTVQFVKR